MEHLLAFLPKRPQPLLLRIVATSALVLFFFLFRIGAGKVAGDYGFILFMPAIILSSLMFDRGSGFYATILSVALLGMILDWSVPALAQNHLVAGLIFFIVCFFLVIITEGLRNALEKSIKLQEEKDVLLRELGHRVKNDLATAISVLAMQARLQRESEARPQLEAAVGRLRVLASSYDHLQLRPRDAAVDMNRYLQDLCNRLGDTLRDIRAIAIRVKADGVMARSEKAPRMGLIVNELVTNALKHAFPDGRSGVIDVELRRTGSNLELTVADNGVGCPGKPANGLGTKLVLLLVEQLGGELTREPADPGCRVRIVVPTLRIE
jgi:two-component sensor histidine kinase